MVEAQLQAINIDCAALHGFSEDCRRLYEQLIKYPQEVRQQPLLCGAVLWASAANPGSITSRYCLLRLGGADHSHHGPGCEPRVPTHPVQSNTG